MDYSRSRQCSNSQGGVSKLYIMPFVDYLESEITVVNNMLVSFPFSTIYDLNAININYNLDGKEDKDIYYDEKVSFQIKKLLETDNFREFIQQDYRIIIKDNNGKFRLLGLRNGLKGEYKEDVGTNRNEFNGDALNSRGKEKFSAPYLNDLSFFNIMPIEGLLLQDGNDNIIQDGNSNEITN